MDEPEWTLDELARRADQALAVEDVRAPNGRAIRWYAMKGLVDRPSIGPGHAARYGERHLLQLVAVKRLQARGMTLAEIQSELAGATEQTLRRIADLADFDIEREPAIAALADQLIESEPAGARRAERFWARPAVVEPADVEPLPHIRYVINLAEDVTLTLPARPEAGDLAAIRLAAAPLLELLAERGLTTTQGD